METQPNGGAINNEGTLNITNCTFTSNNALYGGSIYNEGTLTVTNTTFNNNIGFGVEPSTIMKVLLITLTAHSTITTHIMEEQSLIKVI